MNNILIHLFTPKHTKRVLLICAILSRIFHWQLVAYRKCVRTANIIHPYTHLQLISNTNQTLSQWTLYSQPNRTRFMQIITEEHSSNTRTTTSTKYPNKFKKSNKSKREMYARDKYEFATEIGSTNVPKINNEKPHHNNQNI